jgi:undecaprenyl diphosphate synthase
MKNENIPVHIAIIPDGNRRWAQKRGLEGIAGHARSTEIDSILSLLKETKRLGIKYLSLWGFSTENWKRSQKEKDFLFKLLSTLVDKLRSYALENKVRFRHIGRKDRLPKVLISKLEKIEQETKDFKELNVQICLDYGGRDEIVRAIKKIPENKTGELDEEDFTNYLDTKEIPEPDMIIRTGGEFRLSGFMSYQSTYSELYFTEVFFPDFNAEELKKAVEEFSRRKRTFGGDK